MTDDQGPTIEERIDAIERRLAALERDRDSAGRPATPPVVSPPREPSLRFRVPDISAALVLGWSGAAALVLAAGYLVRLSIAYGWLTPERQMLAAGAVGVALVVGGLLLRLKDRDYAGLLAAAGVAVLYLALFGAHLHHELIGPRTATGLAVIVAALSLGLWALHRGALFVSLALAGSYATPLLVPGGGELADLAIYLTIWNGVYGALALALGRRGIYLAALYASLLVFDFAAVGDLADPWRVEAGFQAIQFALFGAVVVGYAVRHRPLEGWLQGALHYGALLLFYAVEYSILHDHLTAWAPWIAVGFAASLYGAWAVAGRLGGEGVTAAAAGSPDRAEADEVPASAESPRADRTTSLRVVHAFAALVVFHAVWVDGVAWEWRPAAALAMAAALFALPRLRPELRRAWRPWWVAAVALFAAGWIHMLLGWDVPDRDLALAPSLVVLWPAWLYAEYARRSMREPGELPARAVLIAFAHVLAVAGWALLVERWWGDPTSMVEHLWLSMGWAAVGVVTLVAAWRRADALLARSSLGIFALFAAKVALVDLDRTTALVRVGILAVLGAALYAGGWIYRRVIEPEIESAREGTEPVG